jgi:L-iditol 2-dehydrogenase
VFGHEPVGEIAAVGEGVTGFAPGDRVFVHHHAPCFRCRACARGEFVQCPTWKQSQIDPGGMAEFFRVPAGNLSGDTLRLPDHVSDADGALVEPLACVVKSLARAGDVNGATVLIIGLGVMGQLHVLLARHLGAARILAADLVAERCAVAAQLGADVTIDAGAAPLAEQVRALTVARGRRSSSSGPRRSQRWRSASPARRAAARWSSSWAPNRARHWRYRRSISTFASFVSCRAIRAGRWRRVAHSI